MVTKRKDWYKNKLISIFGAFESQKLTAITYSLPRRGRWSMESRKDRTHNLVIGRYSSCMT